MKKFGSMLLMTLCLTMALTTAAFAATAETMTDGALSISNVVLTDDADERSLYYCYEPTITVNENIYWVNFYYCYYGSWIDIYFDTSYSGSPFFDYSSISVTMTDLNKTYTMGDYLAAVLAGNIDYTYDPCTIDVGSSFDVLLDGAYILECLYLDGTSDYMSLIILSEADISAYADEVAAEGETVTDDTAEPEDTATEIETTELPLEAAATPNASKIYVNGELVEFDAYTINENNYFKLRDLAYILSGTEVGFEVTWDQALGTINLESNSVYTVVSGEMAQGDGTDQTAVANTSPIYMDGELADLAAYTINENNYFKLRDLGELFGFNVSWDGEANSIIINTSEAYTAD